MEKPPYSDFLPRTCSSPECRRAGVILSPDQFEMIPPDKRRTFSHWRLRAQCRECRSKRTKEYFRDRYYPLNKEALIEKAKQWNIDNHEKHNEINKAHRRSKSQSPAAKLLADANIERLIV